jgi:hypothetical protein
MKFTRKTLATSMIAAAGAIPIALGFSATAAAEPAAPAPAPSVPGLPFLQQLATNPAAATQLMQGLTSVLGGMQAAAPAASATPAPAATASVTLPQPPTALPGTAPVNTPAAPAATPQNLLSSLPTGLASLLPQGTPLTGLLPAATSAAAPAATAPAVTAPAPAATAAAPTAGVAPLVMPLSALP